MKRLITDKVLHILVENLSFSDYILVTNDISNLEEEIERLNNIIKEVREYIENTKMFTNGDEKEFTLKETWYGKELLEILDEEKV